MHLRKSDIVAIIKTNVNNFGSDHPDDNIDEIYFDADTMNNCAEAIADDIFKKLTRDLDLLCEDNEKMRRILLDDYLLNY